MKRKILLNIFIVGILTTYFMPLLAQIPKEEKRIYLLDVTASMRGKADEGAIDIMDDVKNKLANAIRRIRSDQGEVVVIPFTNVTFPIINSNLAYKDSISDLVEQLDVKPGDTDIAKAWERGIAELDSTKINYMFLLTDGIHNTGVSKEEMFSTLKKWGDISKDRYCFSFYVMLTPNARDMEISKIAEDTEQMWSIESMDVNVEFVTLPLRSQVNNYKNPNIRFSFPPIPLEQEANVKIEMDPNPYYELKGYETKLKDGFIRLNIEEIQPHSNIPVEEIVKLHFKHDREKHPLLFFVPEHVNLKLINRGVRTMNIRMKR